VILKIPKRWRNI